MGPLTMTRSGYIALLFLFVACGKSSSSPTPPTERPPLPPPTTSTFDPAACDEFSKIVDFALSVHVTRSPTERSRILERAYDDVLKFLEDDAAIANTRKAEIAKALSNLPRDKPICDRLQQVATELVSSRPEAFPSRDTPFIHTLRLTLWKFTQRLDPHSSYDDDYTFPSNYGSRGYGAGLRFHPRTDYEFGREVSAARRPLPYLVVEGIYPKSPNPTILPGTRILEIEGEEVSKFTYYEATNRLNQISVKVAQTPNGGTEIRTREGKALPSTIRVKALRPGDKSTPQEIQLKTGPFSMGSLAQVDWPAPASASVARIRLRNFHSSAYDSFVRAWIRVLKNAQQRESHALILDLRGNPGGQLKQAAWILEALLPDESVMAHTRSIDADDAASSPLQKKFVTEPMKISSDEEPFDQRPIVVLIDRMSASAAEIVAVALQSHRRALVIGERSYGKGTTQHSRSFGGLLDGTVAVTDGYWFSPEGKSVYGTGVIPDIEIEDPVTAHQAKKAGKSGRMTDNGREESLAPPPGDLTLTEPFQPVDPTISEDDLRELRELKASGRMKSPNSCAHLPGDPEFREEDDCLLDWALLFASELAR